jgi:hypothetical protein
MKKDNHISELFREAGVVKAPGDFTMGVMDRIEAEPVRKTYKPIIGRTGRILMMLFIGATVFLSIFYSTPPETAAVPEGSIFSREWEMPSFNLNLDFFSDLNLQPWILGTVVALFLLVISDAGLRRRRLS